MKKIVGNIWSCLLRWAITPLLYLLLIIAAITAGCLVWRHLDLLTTVECPNCVKSYVDWIVGTLGTDVAGLEKDGKFAPIISDILVLLAFVVVIVPLLQAWQYRRRLKRELRGAHGLEVFEVKKEGIDDLEKMLDCYDRADHITVFCGDFDWLQPSNIDTDEKFSKYSWWQKRKMKRMTEKMRDFVVSCIPQEKITLVSSKDIDLVRNGLQNGNNHSLFESLESRFVFGVDIGIKCSLIRHIHDKYAFLYRSHTDEKGHTFNAHIFTGATEGEELINILHKLIESGNWETRVGEHM